jgi:hypothetical protein
MRQRGLRVVRLLKIVRVRTFMARLLSVTFLMSVVMLLTGGSASPVFPRTVTDTPTPLSGELSHSQASQASGEMTRANLFRTTLIPFLTYDSFVGMIWSKNPNWSYTGFLCRHWPWHRRRVESLASLIRRVDYDGYRFDVACPQAQVTYRDVAVAQRDDSREGRLLKLLFEDAGRVCDPDIDSRLEELATRDRYARAYLVQGFTRMKCGKKRAARDSFEKAYDIETLGESVMEGRLVRDTPWIQGYLRGGLRCPDGRIKLELEECSLTEK